MFFSIVVNYFAGLLIEKHADKKKAILIVSVVIDLGLLAFFKYAGFIANNLRVILPFAGIPEISVPLPWISPRFLFRVKNIISPTCCFVNQNVIFTLRVCAICLLLFFPAITLEFRPGPQIIASVLYLFQIKNRQC